VCWAVEEEVHELTTIIAEPSPGLTEQDSVSPFASPILHVNDALKGTVPEAGVARN
jgi:hypothetical protein